MELESVGIPIVIKYILMEPEYQWCVIAHDIQVQRSQI